jgi:hypothetical protein
MRVMTAFGFFATDIGMDRPLAPIVMAFACPIYVASPRPNRTVEPPDGYTQDVYS